MTGRLWMLMLAGIAGTTIVQAETLYVAERIRIGMRADLIETSAVVKTIDTGTPLEVVERFEKQIRVREPQGAEGWIEARFLVPDPPARLHVATLQADLAKSRAQTAEVQAQLKKAQAALAEQAEKIKSLERSAPEKPSPASAPTPVAAKTPSVPSGAAPQVDGGFSYLWLGISFAMLGIGFGAGVRWLRESIRRRSGGMYLRV